MADSLLRVTLDTNIIISALLFGGNSRKIVEKIVNREFRVYTSPRLISELKEVLIKKFKFSNEKIANLEVQILSLFTVINPTKSITVARDPDDNRVLEVAIESGSKIIVTGDKDLLDLKDYKRIRIINPKAFLDSMT